MAQVATKPVIFFVKAKNKPSVMNIPTADEITIRTGDKFEKRSIRYCIGERSIYKDEQSPNAQQAPSISMRDGALIVSPYESTLLEFLRVTDRNGSNENRNPERGILFFENKAEEKAAKSLADEKTEIEARFKVFQLELEEVKSFCSALNLCNPDDKSDDEMRHTMLLFSKRDPVKFIEAINNMPKMKHAYHINNGLSYKVIERRGQSIYWANGELILTAPLSKDAADYFIDKSFDEYKEEYDRLLKTLFPKKEFSSSTSDQTVGNTKVNQDKSISKKVSLAIDNGVIKWDRKRKGYFLDVNDTELHLGNSVADVEKYITENKELLGNLNK